MTHRIYCPLDLSLATKLPYSLTLTEQSARHIQVLRMQPKDTFILFTGQAGQGQWVACIEAMGRNTVEVTLLEHQLLEKENKVAIHIAVAVPANDRMDTLIEKATELGVSSLTPLVSQRSVWKAEPQKAIKKIAHWQGVAIAACAQCGRNTVPFVYPCTSFEAYLFDHAQQAAQEQYWIAHPLVDGHTNDLALFSVQAQSHRILIGPEGGWTDEEVKKAQEANYQFLSLGSRILRTDTAVWSALWLLNAKAML